MKIHDFVVAGDIAGVEQEIGKETSLEARNESGLTPLMVAAASTQAGVEMLQLLINRGADMHALSTPTREDSAAQSVLSIAAKSANHEKIKLLVTTGADVKFVDANGYSVLLHALYGSYYLPPGERLSLLQHLVDAGTPLDATSSYGESVVRVASMQGQFDLVKFFLVRGADAEPLGWSPLFHAVAFGSEEEVANLLDQGAALEQADAWERTPFLLSVHAGRLEIAKLLLARGCDRNAKGRCGTTAILLAISRDNAAMLEWLISEGCDVEVTNDFGSFPLMEAAQNNAVTCVKVLLQAGAVASRKDQFNHGAIKNAASPQIIELLVAVGEDLSEVDAEMRVRLTGFQPSEVIDISPKNFRKYRGRTFGNENPTRMNNPFWDAMVCTRVSAYRGAHKFESRNFDSGPVWCFSRFGQSLTRLPDGRYVEIAGEHEDHYDPDFCIYNDVVVHHGDGTFDIFGYPEADFPTTDFHSATWVAPFIYIIGNLGYSHQRRAEETPVYRLNSQTWKMEQVSTTGENPGWIHGHKAQLLEGNKIRISGGKIDNPAENGLLDNNQNFILNLVSKMWERELS
ncbi:MAG: ankyrin repeat domain-containing protein [Pirellulaceae bacterium]